ncbi:putative peptidoglycan-binding protein [Desulfosarcina variabilis str. Montpellier]|uniref:LysM peptidoglycan-binding domain-containing protein n=1 Tax=Desulfosarcina variabilis TaxID=2300 RepID=UPI003AFAFE1C
MKWKDSGESNGDHPEESHAYYEDDGYPSLKDNQTKRNGLLSGVPLRYIFWGLGIAVVIFLILELGSVLNGQADQARIADLEKKIEQLEQKLQKVDGVDEKVTRIWEQAKSFETFKTRFDRAEASTSLRMDHLAMSLDALQKKSNETIEQLGKLEKEAKQQELARRRTPAKKQTTTKTHTVAKGDTLYSLGRKYDISIEELRTLNRLPKGAVLNVGQVLIVSGSGD